MLPAPEGRQIEALRRERGYADGQVALIDRAGREVLMGIEASCQTGVLLVAASSMAAGLLERVDVPALTQAVDREIERQRQGTA